MIWPFRRRFDSGNPGPATRLLSEVDSAYCAPLELADTISDADFVRRVATSLRQCKTEHEAKTRWKAIRDIAAAAYKALP